MGFTPIEAATWVKVKELKSALDLEDIEFCQILDEIAGNAKRAKEKHGLGYPDRNAFFAALFQEFEEFKNDCSLRIDLVPFIAIHFIFYFTIYADR